MSIAIILTLLFLTFFWLNPSAIISAPNYIILMLGVIVAVLLHYRRSFEIFPRLMTPLSSIVLFVCVALMQLYVVNIPSIAGTYGMGQCVLLYGIVFAFYLPTLMGKSPINYILSSRPFVFVGQRSYSLYLVQTLAAQAVVGLHPLITESPWKAVLTCLVGLIFSDCLYRWVERPMLSVSKKISSRRDVA
jgi:peptidoglycan/LPS O-acetylase OafA/YrhL